MQKATLLELNQLMESGITDAEVHVQITQCQQRLTKNNKPYLEVLAADTTGTLNLKVWGDKPWFEAFSALPAKAGASLKGQWEKGNYGTEALYLTVRPLDSEETTALFGGAPSEKVEQARQEIADICAGMTDPRLKGLCQLTLSKFAARLDRAAAARTFHHARRGGLLEHVAGMMRSAVAVSGVYPDLNKDLLISGVLFHDIGKLWETCYNEHDFELPYSDSGELLGHISLGIELVNILWKEVLSQPAAAQWLSLTPSNAEVRLHLLHLIASHHGELAFGSPVQPKTPEAIALHYIDNLDAKLEMFRNTYAKAEMLSKNVYKKTPPLPTNLFTPLAHCHLPKEVNTEEGLAEQES